MVTAVAAVVAVVLGVCSAASATPGDLDPSFGTGGIVVTDIAFGDRAQAVAIQSDGKIVAAGPTDLNGDRMALARFNTDGSLDATFGSGGTVLTDFGPGSRAVVASVAIQRDGRIVTAGFTTGFGSEEFALVRYMPDGSLDASFGSDGKVLTDIGGASRALALGLQSDGKILAAGGSWSGGSDAFTLARYNADGSLDTSFGAGGKVVTDLTPYADRAYSLAIQPDGKIVAAGIGEPDSSAEVFALARYNADGTLDTSFGSAGRVVDDFSQTTGAGRATSVRLQPDGKIVAAGGPISHAFPGATFALARYDSHGRTDDTFGSGGHVQTSFGGPDSGAEANSLAIQPDGKLIAVGMHWTAAGIDFAVARYRQDGSLDPGFGSGGKVLTPIGSAYAEANSVALQSDGGIVVAGSANVDFTGAGDFAVVRYLGDGQPDSDGDGIPDTRDPDVIGNVISALPADAFAGGGGHRTAFLSRLDNIQRSIAAGDFAGAVSALQDLRRKVDGCGSAADHDDWIADCTAQVQVRTLIDQLIANLS